MSFPQFNYTLGEPMPRPPSMGIQQKNKLQRKTKSGVPAIPLKDKSNEHG